MTKEVKLQGANVEEILSALWAISAVLCFGFGFNGWGWAFAIKATLDSAISIYKGYKEVAAKKKGQP
jgi:hypothetical protein